MLVVLVSIGGCMQLAGMEELKLKQFFISEEAFHFQTNQVQLAARNSQLGHNYHEKLELGKLKSAEADEGDSSCEDDDNLGVIPVRGIRNCCFRISKCIFDCIRLIKE